MAMDMLKGDFRISIGVLTFLSFLFVVFYVSGKETPGPAASKTLQIPTSINITHFAAGLPITQKDSVIVPVALITNQPAAAQIEYGLTTGYGSVKKAATTDNLFHSVLLTNLQPNAIYHYRVKATSISNQMFITPDNTFKTFKCGDNICNRANGERELLCRKDCRKNSCENTVGTYYNWKNKEPRHVPMLMSEINTQFTIAHKYPFLPEAVQYQMSSFVDLTGYGYYAENSSSFTYRMFLSSDINETTTTIPIRKPYYDPGKSFTSPPVPLTPDGAKFSIEWEEVKCTGFDSSADYSAYTNCTRGYNDTTAKSHKAYTYLLAHTKLEEYLDSIKDRPRSGYYVLDDNPVYASPKHFPLYLPLLQKMYLIIRKYDLQNPVFIALTDPRARPSLVNETISKVKANTGLAAFDAFIPYLYQQRSRTNDMLDLQFNILEETIHYIPPFIGLYQGFAGGSKNVSVPPLESLKNQIDTYINRGANAAGFFVAYDDFWRTAYNDKTMREIVSKVNKYAIGKYCPTFSVNPPAIISPADNGTVSQNFDIKFKTSGSFSSYKCEIKTADHEFLEIDDYSQIEVLGKKIVDNAANNQETTVSFNTSSAPKTQYLTVRCWNGSVQNTSTIKINVAAPSK